MLGRKPKASRGRRHLSSHAVRRNSHHPPPDRRGLDQAYLFFLCARAPPRVFTPRPPHLVCSHGRHGSESTTDA